MYSRRDGQKRSIVRFGVWRAFLHVPCFVWVLEVGLTDFLRIWAGGLILICRRRENHRLTGFSSACGRKASAIRLQPKGLPACLARGSCRVHEWMWLTFKFLYRSFPSFLSSLPYPHSKGGVTLVLLFYTETAPAFQVLSKCGKLQETQLLRTHKHKSLIHVGLSSAGSDSPPGLANMCQLVTHFRSKSAGASALGRLQVVRGQPQEAPCRFDRTQVPVWSPPRQGTSVPLAPRRANPTRTGGHTAFCGRSCEQVLAH